MSFPLYIHTHSLVANCPDKTADLLIVLGAVQGATYCTRSNLWNVLTIGKQEFNYLIWSNSWNERILKKKLTILIVQTGNFYLSLSLVTWQHSLTIDLFGINTSNIVWYTPKACFHKLPEDDTSV